MESAKRRVYGFLYDIIALIQSAKRQCVTEEQQSFLPDIQKILEAANGTVEIFEGVVEDSLDLDNLSEETQAELAEKTGEARLTGKILVVDDDAFNREILTRHLERQGPAVPKLSTGCGRWRPSNGNPTTWSSWT
jgi:PleD family two-component response regulator